MAAIFSITMMIAYLFTKEDIHLIASCVFTIASSIDTVAINLRKK